MATYVTGRVIQNGEISIEDLTQSVIQSLLPAGAVMSFAMSAAPVGWLPCDGSAINRTTYSPLFSAIGTTHGNGNGSTTFNVPDLRGYFIRGYGTNSDSTASGALGTKQTAYAGYNTFYGYRDDGDSQTGGRGEMTAFAVNGQYLFQTSSPNSAGYNLTVDTQPGDTRPKNVALLYCIKY